MKLIKFITFVEIKEIIFTKIKVISLVERDEQWKFWVDKKFKNVEGKTIWPLDS